ncbi:DUF6612 family protein [Sporosarcina limicola]|uniref:Lipoprotein n=1 Tax=Sporosarcina limicola TaxID=34101 RepID=A0A927MIS9_9BACL|nr:DUF6612 family protein [Sporosarcina limicola]MBE1554616.1 hypothetical protein [Sporosarcina limicola]
MQKLIRVMGIGLLALLLTACNTNVEAKKGMTARDLLEKGKTASEKLEKVHTEIVFDDSSRTDIPEERTSMKFEINSDASLHPLTLHQYTTVKARYKDPWEIDLYKTEDRVFINDNRQPTWEELPTDSSAELFGTIVANSIPTLDLTLFDEFADDLVLEPIDYGYALKLSLSRDQYKRFNKIVLGVKADDEDSDAFTIIHKMDIEIQFDSRTFYTTDFKMTKQVTTYIDGKFRVYKQKFNAAYSRFDDIKDVKVPQKVLDAAAQ